MAASDHLSSQFSPDQSHLDMAAEAGRHHAAREHNQDVSNVKFMYGVPHRSDNNEHLYAHYGWKTGEGNYTGADYRVSTRGEGITKAHTWPTYSKEDRPFNSPATRHRWED